MATSTERDEVREREPLAALLYWDDVVNLEPLTPTAADAASTVSLRGQRTCPLPCARLSCHNGRRRRSASTRLLPLIGTPAGIAGAPPGVGQLHATVGAEAQEGHEVRARPVRGACGRFQASELRARRAPSRGRTRRRRWPGLGRRRHR